MTQRLHPLKRGANIFRQRQLTIPGRIAIGFVLVMTVVGVLQMNALRKLDATTTDAEIHVPHHTRNYAAFAATLTSASQLHRTAQELVLAVSSGEPPRAAIATELERHADAAIATLDSIYSHNEMTSDAVEAANAAMERYKQVVANGAELISVASVSNAGSTSFTSAIIEAGEEVDRELDEVLIRLDNEVAHFVAATSTNAANTRSGFQILWLVGTVAGLALAIYLAAIVRRGSKKISATVGTIATVDLPRLVKVAGAIGRGDLTQRFSHEAKRVERISGDEFGAISRDINTMVDQISDVGTALDSSVQELRGLVGQAKSFSGRVKEGTRLLAESSDESARAAAEVANAINGVAEGSSFQAQATDDMADSVQRITSITQAAAAGIDEVRGLSDETAGRAETGQSSIDRAVEAMDQITKSFGLVSVEVADLDKQSQEVEDIVRLIRAIADQTNLLALNAAIEAARAGDLGKGFAVVAAEVKKLAEEAATSTEQINEIVDQMRTAVSAAVSAADMGSTTVRGGSETVLSAGESFVHIVRSVQMIHERMQGLGDHATAVTGATEKITERSARLVSVAESNSATGEEVAAASEEAAAASQEIGATAAELNQLADELAKAMDHFVLPDA